MTTIPIGTEFLAVESAMVKYVKSISDNKNVADISAGFTKTFKFFSNGAWLSAACRPAFIKALVAVCDDTAEMTDYSPLCEVLAGEDKLIMRVGGIDKARQIYIDPMRWEMTHVSDDGKHWVNGNIYQPQHIRDQLPSMVSIVELGLAIYHHDNNEVSK